jgi:hypothetical protein
MFEYAETMQPNPEQAAYAHQGRAIPENLTLPPPALLWEWLSYIYQTTGEWWRPPVKVKAPAAGPARNNPVFSVDDFQEYLKQSNPTARPGASGTTRSAAGVAGVHNYTNLKALPSRAEMNPKASLDRAALAKTGFNYRASCYFEEAGRLLEQAAATGTRVTDPENCRSALALIIAWSRFSLFMTTRIGGAGWMALSFSRCASELTMRASKFKSCLDELETAGIIQLCRLAESPLSAADLEGLQKGRTNLTGLAARFWNAHFFQKHTTLYLLKAETSLSLPEFNPFRETLNRLGKTSAAETGLSGSFPLVCINESNNEMDEKNNKRAHKYYSHKEAAAGPVEAVSSLDLPARPGKLESLIANLTLEEKAIYDFLSVEARFEGFYRLEDHRETLDCWEALKFATTGKYTLDQVKARYTQVTQAWESKNGCKNPLALLHWSLTRDTDPVIHTSPYSTKPAGRVQTASPFSPRKFTAQPGHQRKSPTWRKSYPQAVQAQAKQPVTPRVRVVLPDEATLDYSETPAAPLDSPEAPPSAVEVAEPGQFWADMCENLAGRFHLSSAGQNLLKDSKLKFHPNNSTQGNNIQENNSQVEIILRSIWEERQLDTPTRNIISLALRQKLGPGLDVTFSSGC